VNAGAASRALLLLLAGVLIALPALASWGLHRGFLLPRTALVLAAGAAAAGLLLERRLAGAPRPRERSAYPPALAALLAALAVPSLLAERPLLALEGSSEVGLGLAAHAAIAALALGAHALVRERPERARALALALCAGSLGALLYTSRPWHWEAHPGRLSGAFGHANHSSQALLTPLLLGAALALRGGRGRAERALGGAAALAAAVQLALMWTRAAWIAGILGLAALGALRLRERSALLSSGRDGGHPDAAPVPGPRLPRAALAAALLLGAALAAGATLAASPSARGALLAGLRVEAGSTGRMTCWRETLPLLPRRLLLGAGIDAYADDLLAVASNDLARTGPHSKWRDPHSVPLQVLHAAGAPGLLALLALVGIAGRRALKAASAPARAPPERALAAGLFAAIVAQCVMTLFLCPVVSTALYAQLLLGIAAALPLGPGEGEGPAFLGEGAGGGIRPPPEEGGRTPPESGGPVSPEGGGRVRGAGLLAGALLLGPALAYGGAQLKADREVLLCDRAASRGDLDATLDHARRAVALASAGGRNPYLAASHIQRVLAAPGAATRLGARYDEALAEATDFAEEAARAGTRSEGYHAFLATFYLMAGRNAEAEATLRLAVAHDAHLWPARYALAIVLARTGRLDEAEEHLAHVRRILGPDERRPEVERLAEEVRAARGR
jgi:O-antigen ligase